MQARIVLSRGQDLLREQSLEKPVTIVGRDPASDIWVDDIAVSKRHLKLELVDSTLYVEDLQSRNGVRVNGVPVQRQALRHLDVVALGNHKMHVFDDTLLPDGPLGPETTIRNGSKTPPPWPQEAAIADAQGGSAAVLQETQPTLAPVPAWPACGLKPLDGGDERIVRLDEAHTMVGPAGHSCLVVRRRDKLYLTRLSRQELRVNGREVGAASCQIRVGDVIEVGSSRYQVVDLPSQAES